MNNDLIRVYPNPTPDDLNIEIACAFSYEITSINGETIFNGTANKKNRFIKRIC